MQLAWGGPQVIYNGGLQQARVRYYDGIRRRPGLPPGVAALVSSIVPEATVVELVNLDAEGERSVIVQAGAFAEHTIEDVRYTACEDVSWLGDLYDYGHGDPAVTERRADVRGFRTVRARACVAWSGRTKTMISGVAYHVWYLSQFTTPYPGYVAEPCAAMPGAEGSSARSCTPRWPATGRGGGRPAGGWEARLA